MLKAKISKLVIVITSKETGEHVERWQFDVCRVVLGGYRTLILPAGTNIRQRHGQYHDETGCGRELISSVGSISCSALQ